jgi:hypothetical protein
MKLYKLTQEVNIGYEKYDGIIVCAENEDAAKLISPGGFDVRKFNEYSAEWADPEDIYVEYLGEAADHIATGVILVSYTGS